MNTHIKVLLREIANAGNIHISEIQEKIEQVEEEGQKLIDLSKKAHNTKRKFHLWKEGDLIMENLTKAVLK